jgi:lysophospholipase L1-like esterase
MGFSADGRWVASVADALARTADVINRGLSGYTTRTLKAVFPTLLAEEGLLDGAVAVTLFIGANDANIKEINPDQHVPLDEYKVTRGRTWSSK